MTSLLTGTFETEQRKKRKGAMSWVRFGDNPLEKLQQVLTTGNIVQQLPTLCIILHRFHHNTLIDHGSTREHARIRELKKKGP